MYSSFKSYGRLEKNKYFSNKKISSLTKLYEDYQFKNALEIK
jgi:hypothetical protein